MKPAEYRTTYIVSQDTPYHVEDGTKGGTHASTGVLHTGRVVYIQKTFEEDEPTDEVSSYAEGVGIVTLESRFLHRV